MKLVILILSFLIISNVYAGEKFKFTPNTEKINLLEKSYEKLDSLQSEKRERKSGFKAALYSAVIPGAGQYYAESYWRGALYAALEVTAWTVYFIYDKKGNDKDIEMKAYGDEHWSERKYWSSLYQQALNENINVPVLQREDVNGDLWLSDFDSEKADQLRFLEHELDYSHTLPSTHTQQYYEMIYKYPEQFANGWSDAGFLFPYNPNGSNLPGTAQIFRDMRNLSDEYFDIASDATMAALINHVISALDAAWAVKSYNKDLNMQFTINQKKTPYERVKMYGLQVAW